MAVGQYCGGKCGTGRMIRFSRYAMGGQQDIILMLIRRHHSWRQHRLKALKFVSRVTLNLILTPSR